MAEALGKVGHAGLRHRQLACIKKGRFCDPNAPNCCGNTICEDSTEGYGVCCLEEGNNGCSLDEHCCSGLTCDTDLSICKGTETAAPSETLEPRPCGIHGELCEVEGIDSSVNDCCGDMKYNCEEVKDPPVVDGIVGGDRCCMPVGGKGCSFTYHCCGSLDGNYCDPVESRCVYPNGTFPDDSVGLPDCSNEGGECVVDEDCCGDTRLKCIPNPNPEEGEDPPDNVCCIMSGITGCDAMDKCCSGTCDFVTSTCCIPSGESGCEDHTECCPGSYCNSGACTSI